MTDKKAAARRRRRAAPGHVATLLDVARAAGVSTASVSRALARPDLVSEPIRDEVARAVMTLGYVPNAAARALSARRSGVIGVIAGSFEDILTRRAAESFSRRLDSAGYALDLAIASGASDDTVRLARRMLARGVDALAIVGVDMPNEATELCAGRLLPIACVDQPVPGAKFTAFVRRQALELAIRFLRELGHRRIAIAAFEHASRIADVSQAPAFADVSLVDLRASGRHDPQWPLGEAVKQWLTQPFAPSALVCGSDAIAAETLRQCRAQGVTVPQQLSIIGFGDTEIARLARPSLSTLRIPADEAGVAAADFLLAALRGEAFAAPRLSAKVVARESTGPANADRADILAQ